MELVLTIEEIMIYEIKGNYFNGRFNPTTDIGPEGVEHYIRRECPADTSQTLWELPIAYNQVDEIVGSALNGYQFWKKVSYNERINYLKKYQEQVISKQDELAVAIALESGKPLWEAKTEVASVIGKVDVTINDSLPRVADITINEIAAGTTGAVYFRPIGPSLIIGPFTSPCHLANTQILSALITGNSVIFKPSEKVAYSAQLLIDCFHEAGFPKGVVNLCQGDGEIARRLTGHSDIKGVYFTGSKEVGLQILKTTHSDLSKLVALELGGKNASIVHKDANRELAFEELIRACYLTSGQRCTSTSLIPIHRSIANEFIDRFHKISKKIIVDHPIEHEKTPLMGPLIDQRSLDQYLLFMGMAKREGIEEVMRGKHLTRKKQGYYVSPSIHFSEKWHQESHFLQSEIFGPNTTFIPYDDIEEAIHIANATEYGLAAGVFTQDNAIFTKCLEDIECGLVNHNRSTCGASAKLPFGGIKNSGNYHPAAVSMIDGCLYQKASLQCANAEATGIDKIPGINLD